MRMDFALSLEQTQKLIMTPELRQAIAVLQLNALELTEYIDKELQENPLLEIKSSEEGEEREDATTEPAESTESAESVESTREEIDWQDYINDDPEPAYRSGISEPHEAMVERLGTSEPTLTEHLLGQLNIAFPPGQERDLGEYLIGNLDDNGYLCGQLDELASTVKVEPSHLLNVLRVIQSFDPPGIGARSLSECLLIQAEAWGELNEAMSQLIQNHLEDLASGRMNAIAKALKADVQDVQRMADYIKSLDPKPGRNFSPGEVRYVTPDVLIERVEDEYVVLVNDVMVPRLAVNQVYKSILNKERQADEETKKYIENKLNSALWLIRSIEQRRLTLYKVVECLVKLQRPFLDKGIQRLKPLNLRDVAEIVGLHESTVSRATANKFVQTPQGVFELKYFFASGLSNAEGDKQSSHWVKNLLKQLVEKEDPRQPLSDQKIAQELNLHHGIEISRRTVAKYRDEMGILATPQRRRY